MIVLVIPVAALLLALMWVRWARKPAKPLDEMAQVAAHHRRLAALAPGGVAEAPHDPLSGPQPRLPSLH